MSDKNLLQEIDDSFFDKIQRRALNLNQSMEDNEH